MPLVFKTLAQLVRRKSGSFNADWSSGFAGSAPGDSRPIPACPAPVEASVVYGNNTDVSVVDYDPIQGLLAIGTTNTTGLVKLYGRERHTAVLKPKDSRAATVKFLRFKPGQPVLVSIDSQNTLTLFDLRTGREFFTHSTRNTVTCIELLHSTDWLLVGFGDGTIDVYDASRGWRSPYTILDQHGLVRGVRVPRQIPEIAAMAAQPGKLGKLLIAYSTGLIILWNFITRSHELSFLPLDVSVDELLSPGGPLSGTFSPQLTALAFHPDGTHFATGYEDGHLAFWDVTKNRGGIPLVVRTVQYLKTPTPSPIEPANPVILSPVFRLSWCSLTSGVPSGATRLVVAGGTNLATQPSPALHVLDFDASKNYASPVNVHNLVPPRSSFPSTNFPGAADSVPPPVSNFLILPQSLPWQPAYDPVGVCVIINGQLRRFTLPIWSKAGKNETAEITPVCLEESDVPSDLRLGQGVSCAYLVSDIKAESQVGEQALTDLVIVKPADGGGVALESHSEQTTTAGGASTIEATELPQHLGGYREAAQATVKCVLITVHTPDNTLCAWDSSGSDEGRGLGSLLGSIYGSELAKEDAFDGQERKAALTVTPTVIHYLHANRGRLAVGYSNGTVLVFDAALDAETSERSAASQAVQDPVGPAEENLSSQLDSQDVLGTSDQGEIREQDNAVTADKVRDKPLPTPPSAEAAAPEIERGSGRGSTEGITVRIAEQQDASSATRKVFRLHATVQGLHHCPRLFDHASGVLLAIGCDEGTVVVVDLESGGVICCLDVSRADKPEGVRSASNAQSSAGHSSGAQGADSASSVRFAKSVLDNKDLVPRVLLLIGTQRGRNVIYSFMKQNEEAGAWTVNEESSFRLSEQEPLLYLAVLDAHGNEAAPLIERSGARDHSVDEKENPPTSHLLISVTPRTVRANLNCSAAKLYKTTVGKQSEGAEVTVMAAGFVRRKGSIALLCLRADATVCVLGLPKLRALMDVQLGIAGIIGKAGRQGGQVLPSGQVFTTIGHCEFGIFDPVDHRNADTRWEKLYDPGRSYPTNPAFTGGSGGGILEFFGIGGKTEPSEAELDELLGGASRPRPKVSSKQQLPVPDRLYQQQATAEKGAASGSAFAQAKAGLDERGEKLNELSQKLGGMEEASKDFLESVRQYNARQANKKWYEF